VRAGAAVPRLEAPDVAAVLLRAVLLRAVRPWAVVLSAPPSAVAWAVHQDPALPSARPAPQPAALFADAMPRLRTALRREPWWQAARDEVLS
jgi:hypothetical protein